MQVIVCVKQVPGTNKVEVDEKTGVLKRAGVASKLNPYDLFALETAFVLAEKTGGRVKTLSMGPPQAKEALKETLWMGAEHGVLLCDRAFAGADVAATSYALSLGAKKMGDYDLILCGKQTTDGDTAQVGPELAERLHIEHAANVICIGEADENGITVTIDLDSVLQTQRMAYPCLLTIDKDANTPRLPSYRRKKAIDAEKNITLYTACDLPKADKAKLGLKGSPTQVERIFPPEKNVEKKTLTGTGTELANALYKLLREQKFV
jgi:electron transfer flavoprotein beta subunit